MNNPRNHWLSAAAIIVAAVMPALVSAASINVRQTFSNNTAQAANGLDWYFAPDTTVSNSWSNVFNTATTTHYATPPATPTPPAGASSAVRIRYTGGNVNGNGAGTATVGATLTSSKSSAYGAQWLNNGTSIGSAQLPFSFGGTTTYRVGINDLVWNTRIDNPNSTTVMIIDSLKYAFSTINLAGPALDAFSPPSWTNVGSGIAVDPESEFDFDTSAITPDQLVVVDATIHLDGSSEESQIRFQLVPEPSVLGLLMAGVGLLAMRRRRRI